MKEMIIELWALENVISIIIEDKKSPIVYSNQTNGYACNHPGIKGYLIPIEFDEDISQNIYVYFFIHTWYNPKTSFTVMYDDIGNTFQVLKTTLTLLYSGSTSQLSVLIFPNRVLENHISIGVSTWFFKPT